MKKVLLLIDIQNDYFEGGKCELVNANSALKNAEKALTLFRERGLPIVHVQHLNLREGATFFLPNTDGILIHSRVAPMQHEYIVIKDTPNSFWGTNLLDILKQMDVNSLVVCGMMSHMCIDATVRTAFDYGFDVTLLEDACTTKDLAYKGKVIPAETVHFTFMASLDKMFARVIKTSELQI